MGEVLRRIRPTARCERIVESGSYALGRLALGFALRGGGGTPTYKLAQLLSGVDGYVDGWPGVALHGTSRALIRSHSDACRPDMNDAWRAARMCSAGVVVGDCLGSGSVGSAHILRSDEWPEPRALKIQNRRAIDRSARELRVMDTLGDFGPIHRLLESSGFGGIQALIRSWVVEEFSTENEVNNMISMRRYADKNASGVLIPEAYAYGDNFILMQLLGGVSIAQLNTPPEVVDLTIYSMSI
jgi:hypothetical protein